MPVLANPYKWKGDSGNNCKETNRPLEIAALKTLIELI
jgi:hypothetical protein